MSCWSDIENGVKLELQICKTDYINLVENNNNKTAKKRYYND